MTHSIQCNKVLSECDFDENAYRIIEKYLLMYTPEQMISVIWKMDKTGIHDIEWFISIFNGKYMKKFDLGISVLFDDVFWDAYDLICKFIDPFDIRNIIYIQEMSSDMQRIKEAIKKSQPNLKYLYKVWSGSPIMEKTIYNNVDSVPEIKKYEVNTVEFN